VKSGFSPHSSTAVFFPTSGALSYRRPPLPVQARARPRTVGRDKTVQGTLRLLALPHRSPTGTNQMNRKRVASICDAIDGLQ
jgi:hypothetical protein